MTKTLWKATAEPVGKFWSIKVDGLGGATQARSVKEIDVMVRDFIEAKTDAASDSFDVSVVIELPQEIKLLLAHVEELRSIEDRVRKEAASEARLAARALKDSGLTVRDVGAALGISFQRAQQLIKG